jgi:REP element-mobilizing transposase RayT
LPTDIRLCLTRFPDENDRMQKKRWKLRLPDFDYRQPGSYFVTICTHDRQCVLGDVVGEQMCLSSSGEIIRTLWQSLPERHEGVSLDEFVVMPNHLHAIVELAESDASLPLIIGAFKSVSTKAVNAAYAAPGRRLWQRSFHEHVIRDETARGRIREYIQNNPQKWHIDRENPVNWGTTPSAGGAEPRPYK